MPHPGKGAGAAFFFFFPFLLSKATGEGPVDNRIVNHLRYCLYVMPVGRWMPQSIEMGNKL